MGHKLKIAREAKKMTQEELAAKSGVSRATISAIENGGEHMPGLNTLFKLANALSTTVDDVFDLNGLT